MVSVNHPFPIKLIYSFPFFFLFFIWLVFSPHFFPKVVLSEVASNYIVRTQHSVTPPATSRHLLQIPFCWAVPRGLNKVSSVLCASHTLGNHWKKYILHPRHYSETLPKKAIPNANKMAGCFHYGSASIRCILSGKASSS